MKLRHFAYLTALALTLTTAVLGQSPGHALKSNDDDDHFKIPPSSAQDNGAAKNPTGEQTWTERQNLNQEFSIHEWLPSEQMDADHMVKAGGASRQTTRSAKNNARQSGWVTLTVAAPSRFKRTPAFLDTSAFRSTDAAFTTETTSSASLSFTDITDLAGTGGPTGTGKTGGHAVIWSDVDNDGRPDLYITMLFNSKRSDLFFRNTGGNIFSDEGDERGIDDFDGGSHGATFADLDNDGDFDLFNGTTGLLGDNPAPEHNNIFRNNGNGFFIDATPGTDIEARLWPTRGVVAFDMDKDGDLDLLAITNFQGSDDPAGERNELYRNQGNFSFLKITSGDLYQAPAGQGATDTDYDNDGDVDIIAGNRTGDVNILRNDGTGNFDLISPASIGIHHQGREGVTMGDVNNDGHLDMLLSDFDETRNYELEHLYLNSGDGTFAFQQSFSRTEGYMGAFGDLDNDGDLDIVFAGDDVCFLNDGAGTFSAGPTIPVNGGVDPRAVAFADIDNDGDLDFAIADKRSHNSLIRNNLNGGHWLKVILISPLGQIGAFGAKVKIYRAGEVGGELLGFREARSSNGYLGQNDPVLHFGLGAVTEVDLEVIFLDGTVVTRTGVQRDQTITISPSSGGDELAFIPTDDAQVKLTEPGSNYGSKSTMKLGKGAFNSYVKFQVTGLNSAVTKAIVRLRVSDGSTDGGDQGGAIHLVSDNFSTSGIPWTEAALTAGNAPVIETEALSTLGPVAPLEFVEFDVTAAIAGDGIYSFALKGLSGNRVRYCTKEGPHPPRLLITTDGGSVNQAPVATDDNATTSEGTAVVVEVTANDSDPDGTLDLATVAIVTPPANGLATVDGATGAVAYTPAAGFTGSDAFTYTIDDDEGATSNEATVTVAVTEAETGMFTFQPTEDAQVKLTDIGRNYGTKTSAKIEKGKFRSYLKFDVSGLTGNIVDARLRLRVSTNTTDGGEHGGEIYLVSNDFNNTNSPWQEEILTAGNAPAITGSPLNVLGPVSPGEIVEFNLLAAISAPGVYSFALSNPTSDRVKYYTKEGGTPPELVIVTQAGGQDNQPPVAANDNATTASTTPVGIAVTGNDSDADGTIDVTTVLLTSQPTNGTADVDAQTGEVTYTPDPGFTGEDLFTYTVEDNDGATSNEATVTVLVVDNNQPPVAVEDQATTSQGVPVDIDVPANDSDPDGALDLTSVKLVTPPGNGTATINGATGAITYTPNQTFAGVDLFTYTIDDNIGATSSAANVAVTVTASGGAQTLTFLPTDDGQVKITDASRNYGAKGTAKLELGKFRSYFKFDVSGLDGAIQSARLQLHVTTNSTDGSDQGGAAYLVSNDFKSSTTPWREDLLTSGNAPDIGGPALSTIGAVVPNEVVEFDVTAAISGNGVVSFALSTPSGNQVKYFTKEGAFPPTLIIETASGGAENQAPTAQDDQATTNEDTPVDISVTNNDSDSDGVLDLSSVQIATAPSNGSAAVAQSSGMISYTPSQDFFGTDSFTYTVGDDDGATSNVATVMVIVSGVNDPPVAVDDAATLTNGTPIILTVTDNDFDVDGTIDLTSINIVDAPGKGSIVVNPFSGLITYTPGAGFSGSDAFTYEVNDNNGATSNIATATIMEEGGTTPTNTFTFHPTDDGQVKLTGPGRNYGSKGTMKVEEGKFESYMKFDVSGLTGSVLSARLRLSVGDDGQNGGSLYLVANTYSGTSTSWDESGLNASNAPQVVSGALQALGPVHLGDIIDLDVTSVIHGNGIYSFAVKGGSTDQTKFGTKEGLNPMPELVIEAGGGPPTAPLITSFHPTSGPVNTEVTIVGQNLAGVDAVTFGGVAANFGVDSDAQIAATVPAGATTGRIEVTKAGIRATSADVFTVDAPAISAEMEIVINTDDQYNLYVNGVLVGSNDQWNVAQTYVVPVRNGQNVLAVKGRNDGGDVGMIAEVTIDGEVVLRSGTSWHVHLTEEPGWTDVSFDDAQWSNADDFGGYGVAPWKKNILNFPKTSSAHWIWDEQEPSTLYLRGSFHFGPPQITSFSPGSGLVGSEVSITGINLAPIGGSSLPNTIKVMPLGNSITRGVTGSTDNAGYRNDLAELLGGAGISYDFVGSLQNGTGFDNDHEGHSGFWADEVLADIDGWLRQNPPDMVLFHIGTNDISSDQSNTSTIDEIGQNLDVIRNFDAGIITLLAGIIPRKGSKDATTTALVAKIKDLVTQRQAAGENVFYAGMNEAFKANPNWQNEYFPAGDNVHPNDIGYAVMAGVWSDLITTILAGAGNLTVEFNGVAATKVFVDSDSQIRATVPPGATSGRITVTNALGTAVSPADFTVLTTTVAALEFSNPGPAVDWAPGSTHTLTWNTLGEVDFVRLDYSTDGGSIWQTLDDRVENTGKVAWTTPAVPFSHLMVRIADADHQSHVNEMTVKVGGPAGQTEFPNGFEVRRALFDLKAENTEALSRSDLDNSGRVDLVDYLNLLDLDNRGLRSLKAGRKGDPASTGTLEVSIPSVTPVAGAVHIPVLLAGGQPIRGFQFLLEFDSSQLDLTGALPYRNDFGMRLEGVISGNTLQVIGYLEKENSAVEINGELFVLRGKLVGDAEGDVAVRLVERLFVSKERLPITNSNISTAGPASIPTEFALLQNYPNPFNPGTQITFHLPQRAKVEIKIYNLKGELVRTLVNEEREPGRHKIIWNGKNGAGVAVASGLYLYRIRAGKWQDTRRMMLVK